MLPLNDSQTWSVRNAETFQNLGIRYLRKVQCTTNISKMKDSYHEFNLSVFFFRRVFTLITLVCMIIDVVNIHNLQ